MNILKEVNHMINIRKAAIIGCGFVGASTAFSLVHKGLFSELVLIDADHGFKPRQTFYFSNAHLRRIL